MKKIWLVALAFFAARAFCAPVECPADVVSGHSSFTIELLVKSPVINYATYCGNRSVAPWYPLKGFSLGMTKTGRFSAVIGDGERRAYTWWEHIKAPWIPGTWTHVAMTRDGENEKLTLFVNGVKGPNETRYCDGPKRVDSLRLDITSSKPLQSGGLDGMTGVRFDGEIKGLKITKGLIPDDEIAARAKKAISGLKKATLIDQNAKPVTVVRAKKMKPVPLTLVPVPKKWNSSGKNVEIDVNWTAKGLDDVGTRALQDVLSRMCAMTNGTGKTRFEFADAKGTHPEEFSVTAKYERDGTYLFKITADGAAKYYAMEAISQIIRIASLENGKKLSAPESFDLKDWPSIATRLAVTPYGTLDGPSPADKFESLGREMAFMRMNGMHLSTGKIKKLDNLKMLFDACHTFGIDPYSWISYMFPENAASPLRPDAMKVVEDWVRRDCELGATGFTIAFDDLMGKYLKIMKEEPEKSTYGTMGNLHNAVARRIIDVSKEYGVKKWLAIPFEYGVKGDGTVKSEYFKDFTKGFKKDGVVMMHTVFDPERVQALYDSGAETYGWYVNGMWPTKLFFTWYMGMERIAWTWNMFYCDRNGRGPAPFKERIADVRTVHNRSKVFFGASSTTVARYMAGWLPWNPEKWDENLCGRALCQRSYGSGVWEPLERYAESVAPMVGFFMAYKTSWTTESKAPDTPRENLPTWSELEGYARNLKDAKEAREEIAKAFENQTTPFDLPAISKVLIKVTRQRLLKDIDDSISEIESKLNALMK